jgi:hypothetical protein
MNKTIVSLGFNLAMILSTPAMAGPLGKCVTPQAVGNCAVNLDSSLSVEQLTAQIDSAPPAAGSKANLGDDSVDPVYREWVDWDGHGSAAQATDDRPFK